MFVRINFGDRSHSFTFPGGEGGPRKWCDELLATQGGRDGEKLFAITQRESFLLQIIPSQTEMPQNTLANNPKVISDSVIGISQNLQTKACKLGIAFSVRGFVLRGIMLSSVNLNNCIFTANIKIHNKVSNVFLSVDRHRQQLKKLIPQLFLFIRHILAKMLSISDKFCIIL